MQFDANRWWAKAQFSDSVRMRLYRKIAKMLANGLPLLRILEELQTRASFNGRKPNEPLAMVLDDCRRLVQKMDGEIGVESEPGRGSRFHFSARFGLPEVVAAPPDDVERLHGMRVLVVDDNECAREQLVGMACAMGLTAEATADGTKALEVITAADGVDRPFDLVLLDWKMPGMDGVEVACRLASTSLRHQPPSVLMAPFWVTQVPP